MTTLTASTFQAFGPSHLLALAIFVAGIWPVVLLGRAQLTSAARRRTSRWFAAAITAFTVPMQLVDFLPGQYSFSTTLPLQLCDFAWMAAVAALLTHHRFFVALAYFWGLVLTTQGLLTPWLNADFPHPKYIGFWGMHVLIVWAAVFLVWGLGLRPAWRDYATTVATTATWAISVFTFNVFADTNYGFLNHKPSSSSLLDHLGPWPTYVVMEVLIVATVWALMTWPWVRRNACLRAGWVPAHHAGTDRRAPVAARPGLADCTGDGGPRLPRVRAVAGRHAGRLRRRGGHRPSAARGRAAR